MCLIIITTTTINFLLTKASNCLYLSPSPSLSVSLVFNSFPFTWRDFEVYICSKHTSRGGNWAYLSESAELGVPGSWILGGSALD